VRVVVPCTDLRPETAAALARAGVPYGIVRMDGDDAYWRLLASLWAAGETFAVVEQDIVIGPGTLQALEACPGGWCAFGYPYLSAQAYYGLGCTKFAAPLLARVPGAMERVAVMYDEGHPPKHWCRLDAWLTQVLTASGEKRCEHTPPAGHLHRYPAHGCVPGPP